MKLESLKSVVRCFSENANLSSIYACEYGLKRNEF